MTERDLAAFGGGVDQRQDEEPNGGPDRRDGAAIAEQCIAQTTAGERCKNAVSHMQDGPFCGAHANVEDVQVVIDE